MKAVKQHAIRQPSFAKKGCVESAARYLSPQVRQARVQGVARRVAEQTILGVALPNLEFRTLDITAPDIDGAANRIDNRRIRCVVETAMAPT